MLTVTEGAIAKIDFPPDFELNNEFYGGMGLNWLRKYSPKNGEDVSMTLYYRGAPELAKYAETFRKLLKTPAVIFDDKNGPSDESAKEAVIQMQSCLGNAGNNQITNQREGLEGPRFFLEKIQTIQLCGRPVMAVQGYFYGPDGETDNQYMGVFFDATPTDPQTCRIEEVIFEAGNWDTFEKYFPQFQSALNTIRWS